MFHSMLVILTIACVLGSVRAYYGQFGVFGQTATFRGSERGSEWLMDDPHKADRMPVWRQLLRNQGFMTRSHESTGTNTRGGTRSVGWNRFGGNMNWMPFFMNFDH